MSLRLKHRKKDNKWRIWTSISDGWITDWLTEDEAKEALAEHYQADTRLKIIEAYMTFPEGWADKDTWKRFGSGEKIRQFNEWQLRALESGDYEAEVAKKYKELTGRRSE